MPLITRRQFESVPKANSQMPASNLAPIPELFVSFDSATKLKNEAAQLPSWDLSPRQVCDLELLMNGGFHPLKGFMGRADYDSVVESLRLEDGTLFPMPITLDVSSEFAATIEPDQDIALRDAEGVILAILSISDVWTADKSLEAEKVFGNFRGAVLETQQTQRRTGDPSQRCEVIRERCGTGRHAKTGTIYSRSRRS